MNKAIILIGGPSKGTRFRPLSLYLPKPLFPIGGFPLIYQTIESLAKVQNLKEIILLGSFNDETKLNDFINMCKEHFKINIKYLKESELMGSAGGIFKYKKDILSGNVDKFFVVNGDVLGDMHFDEMLQYHNINCAKNQFIILGKYNDIDQSSNFGCISYDETSKKVLHFVEKPTEFTSNVISCGAYLFTPEIFNILQSALVATPENIQNGDLLTNVTSEREPDTEELSGDGPISPSKNINISGKLSFEFDVFPNLAGPNGNLFAYILPRSAPWIQVKSSGSAAYANEVMLQIYEKQKPNILATSVSKGNHPDQNCYNIKGPVYIHPTAQVHKSAVLGPFVSIGAGVIVGSGARIAHSIICDNAQIKDHAFITCSIIGWNSIVGLWTRIEGTMHFDTPNAPDVQTLFTGQGKLNPSITIIANDVDVHSELVVYNAIVLPHKELKESIKNQIVL